jgi:hypothetical protein
MLSDDRQDSSIECGCAWNDDRYVMLNPDVVMGDTVVARSPSEDCPACHGTGRVRDNHHFRQVERDVGETAGSTAGRQGHYSPTRDEDHFLAEGGWAIQDHDWKGTGGIVGRPKTTIHEPGVLEVYIQDVFDEISEDFWWMFGLDGDEFAAAMEMFVCVWYAKAESANARAWAKKVGTSKDTVYRMRTKGNMFLDQLDRIEKQLQENAAESRAQWERLFTKLYNVDEAEFVVPDYPDEGLETKP